MAAAAERGDVAALARCFDSKGANVNEADWSGHTPLMLAAARGHKSAVEFLLAKRADLNASERIDKLTSLMRAVAHGHKDVCEALLTAGADRTIANESGETAAELALATHDRSLFDFIVGWKGPSESEQEKEQRQRLVAQWRADQEVERAQRREQAAKDDSSSTELKHKRRQPNANGASGKNEKAVEHESEQPQEQHQKQPQSAENWRSCEVCFEVFDVDERRPLNLNCGHTFCLLCCSKLAKEKTKSKAKRDYARHVDKPPNWARNESKVK